MTHEELVLVRRTVAEVAAEVQPLLQPVPGLSRRNAPAHLWLGIRERFGPEWRVRALASSVLEMLEWMRRNPNGDYGAWPGPPQYRQDWFAEELFSRESTGPGA